MDADVDLSRPDVRETHPEVVHSLRQILGPVLVIEIAGDTVIDPVIHGTAILRLADAAGEVVLTVPATLGVGHSFAVSSPPGSWPRIEVGPGGTLEHAYGHAAGLPKGMISVFVAANVSGGTAVVQLSGATQP